METAQKRKTKQSFTAYGREGLLGFGSLELIGNDGA
ncbi:hypothetical protein PVOR_25788 [Paenibacillus vortex V453]|jgi:hypothetical protein|uniref:Uncharacterized protein n=1 Tax=Paenibacillus vortex V453 TaxID=715225 RepID=A0A2R9SPI5_9BACL|nr:hypothetical protein PVOR_25788 [Paenibacillus vortex V453]MDH6670016.1 hypothetical protein [Paenibacillus sp. LBL]